MRNSVYSLKRSWLDNRDIWITSSRITTVQLYLIVQMWLDHIEYRSVTSSKNFVAFQHFHDHISVEHDEKHPHTNLT